MDSCIVRRLRSWLLLLLVLNGCLQNGCKQKLTRHEVSQLIGKELEAAEVCRNFIWPRTSITLAQKDGLIIGDPPDARFTEAGATWLAGIEFFEHPVQAGGFLRIDPAFGSHDFMVRIQPAMSRRLVEVTGLADVKEMTDGTSSMIAAEYRFEYVVPNEAAALKRYLALGRKTTAILRLFDDGWRVESLGLEGAVENSSSTPPPLQTAELKPQTLVTVPSAPTPSPTLNTEQAGDLAPPIKCDEWLSFSQFGTRFREMLEKRYYPTNVMGKADETESTFCAKFVPFPDDSFAFYCYIGLIRSDFKSRDKELTDSGFERVEHQTFIDSEGVERNQALWTNRRTPKLKTVEQHLETLR